MLPTGTNYQYIGIVYKDTVAKVAAFLKLHVEPVKQFLPNTAFVRDPDIVMFKLVGLRLNAQINVLNKYFYRRSASTDQPEKVISWGYGLDYTKPNTKKADSIQPILWEGVLAELSELDPQYLTAGDTLNFTAKPMSRVGHSGAPAFFRYKKFVGGSELEWYEFAGMQFGGSEPYNYSYFITRETVMVEVKKTTPFIYTF